MAELYDKDGNLVEGALTKEEHEAAITTKSQEAVEAYKAANPPKEEKQEEKQDGGEKTAAELAAEAAEAAVAAALRARDISDMAKLYAPGDATKQNEIIQNAGRLQGYEATAEGLASQMEAAASMAGIDVKGVDISGITSTGGGRNVDTAPKGSTSEVDKSLQTALGIKPEDAEKYGKEGDEATK